VVLVACGFAVATVATRLPLRGRYLFDWDAQQFALGIQRFDLAAHRPHPPGYIGYIYLGRLLTHLTGATIESVLTAVSIAGEAATVVGLYLVARRLFGEFAGLAAALLLLSSPLYWMYGETALTYGLEPGLALLGFWLLYRASRQAGRGLVLAAGVIGLEGAIRESSEVF
jgi:Dolichyl-phosphate-mannose-protein mannosyltransferase